MNSNKFFRVLWKLNAILILLIGVGLIFIFLALLHDGVGRSHQTDSLYLGLPNKYKNKDKETWYFGEVTKIENTIIMPFLSTQYFSTKNSEKEVTATRNYLFVNLDTDSSFWLFDNNKFVISKMDYISKEIASSCSEKLLVALSFTIHKADTNGDNAIKRDDIASIALTNLDGSGYTEIEQNVNFVKDIEVINEGHFLILFYKKESKMYISKYSLAEFKKISDVEISFNNKLHK